MSETLCTLRTKGGGGLSETVLWTNSAPTSAFAAQNVTLSEDINNYKYLKITYAVYTNVSTTESVIYTVADIKKSNQGSNTPYVSFAVKTSTSYTRFIAYINDTKINISNAFRGNNTGSDTSAAIPLEILGLNELDHGVRPTIPYFGTNVTGANTRSAASLKIDTEDYDTLTIGSVTKDSGITVKNAQIRDANNTTIYTINVSNSMQTFDVSNYSVVIIVLDAQGTTAWTSLVANNISLSK